MVVVGTAIDIHRFITAGQRSDVIANASGGILMSARGVVRAGNATTDEQQCGCHCNHAKGRSEMGNKSLLHDSLYLIAKGMPSRQAL